MAANILGIDVAQATFDIGRKWSEPHG